MTNVFREALQKKALNNIADKIAAKTASAMTTEREMAETVRSWAASIDNDGTPSQVGPTSADCLELASLLETVAAERDALDKLIAELKRWDTFAFGGNVSQQGGVGIMKTEMLERLTAIRSRSGSKP